MNRYSWAISISIVYLKVQSLIGVIGACFLFLLGINVNETLTAFAYLLSGFVLALFSYALAQCLTLYLLIAKRLLTVKKR